MPILRIFSSGVLRATRTSNVRPAGRIPAGPTQFTLFGAPAGRSREIRREPAQPRSDSSSYRPRRLPGAARVQVPNSRATSLWRLFRRPFIWRPSRRTQSPAPRRSGVLRAGLRPGLSSQVPGLPARHTGRRSGSPPTIPAGFCCSFDGGGACRYRVLRSSGPTASGPASLPAPDHLPARMTYQR